SVIAASQIMAHLVRQEDGKHAQSVRTSFPPAARMEDHFFPAVQRGRQLRMKKAPCDERGQEGEKEEDDVQEHLRTWVTRLGALRALGSSSRSPGLISGHSCCPVSDRSRRIDRESTKGSPMKKPRGPGCYTPGTRLRKAT